MNPIELDGDRRALFASDVHAGDHDAATTGLFLATLREHAKLATDVFLLGDLFEAWVGDDHNDRASADLVETLAQLTREGRRLYVMRGNRDFLLDVPMPAGGAPAFSGRCGAVMLEDPCVVRLWGEPALLAHGDALCTDDAQYQAFRAMSRRPEWQRGLLARPLAERLAMARALRAESETSKDDKADYLMDVNAQAVVAAMREAGVRLLIHGHTHRPARHTLLVDGEPAVRWVLPDWSAAGHRGGMLLAGPDGLEPVGPWSGGR